MKFLIKFIKKILKFNDKSIKFTMTKSGQPHVSGSDLFRNEGFQAQFAAAKKIRVEDGGQIQAINCFVVGDSDLLVKELHDYIKENASCYSGSSLEKYVQRHLLACEKFKTRLYIGDNKDEN